MAERVDVNQGEWENKENKFKYCQELEKGNILFFPEIPFTFPKEEIDFLLTQKQGGSKARKNISYKPGLDKVSNHNAKDTVSALKLHNILRSFSRRSLEFLSKLLAPYAKEWKTDYASFRPFQEMGRKFRVRARNDLLHVDAFPTRPLHGGRILRFFININPKENRHWVTSLPFKELAEKFLDSKELSAPKTMDYSLKGRLERKMREFLYETGFKIPLRSPYDEFMLKMHNFLKENREFQENCQKDHWNFPPNSCWVVFTDQVSHAALSGQYALEQTLIIPQKALLFPEESPLGILERLSGKNLVNPAYSATLFK